MLLHISETATATLQEQIIDQIRARILSGELAADFPLPSIRGLANELRVSVITVQRAYDHLLAQQLIYARRGKGFYVARLQDSDKSALARKRFAEQQKTLVESARRDGLQDEEIAEIVQNILRTGDHSHHA